MDNRLFYLSSYRLTSIKTVYFFLPLDPRICGLCHVFPVITFFHLWGEK